MTNSTESLKAAMRQEMTDRGLPLRKGSTEMSDSNRDDGVAKTPPIAVDFKLPLAYLVGGAIFIGSGLIGMYYQLANVSEKVTSMQSDLKANGAMTIEFAKEQAVMKFRLEKLEQDNNRKDRS